MFMGPITSEAHNNGRYRINPMLILYAPSLRAEEALDSYTR